MNKRYSQWRWAVGLALALTIGIAGVALAQGAIALARQVLGAGGASVSSGNVAFASTMGQPFIGSGTTGNVVIGHGFWFGLGAKFIYLPGVLRDYRPPSTYAPPCGPANNYCEPNNGKSSSYGPLGPGAPYQAYAQDAEDWYYITLNNTGSVAVQLTNFQATGYLYLYDKDNAQLGVDNNVGVPGKITLSVNAANLPAGSYYIRIYTYPDSLNPSVLYTLTITY